MSNMHNDGLRIVEGLACLAQLSLILRLELHNTAQTLTKRTHDHPCEYTYANPTPMPMANVAYHLMHNAGKSRKRCEHQDSNLGG
jgi:hypothetical protein